MERPKMPEVMVGTLADFPDGDHRVIAIGDFEVGIFRRGDRLVAWENRCPHYGGPVCQGRIFHRVEEPLGPDKTAGQLRFGAEEHIVCPWHGYEYELMTGRHSGDPRLGLRAVAVRADGSNVYLDVPSGPREAATVTGRARL
jgi:nitrite reductase/ring-hydroxylating ferredoxin subunit